ncbi:MAG: methylenetetrahydrofolate--tRNA-(uracil(54)-C(5))-methyltransferase (FADH(2)-oxidizing) TrmFO [Clostridiales bacterium]|nr:methylenetetrahydrofolate--tRNA-(uracil(54)-C(5))-methyltransferase (FADH(2)-oxidizing) TrmFO [Clostridiales bacterium]
MLDKCEKKAVVIGAGLAGSEAAWQLARRGIKVTLYEMRPNKSTPAHTTGLFGELVCSNSLKAMDVCNAHGLLKEELRTLGSLIIEAADATSVPAGGALAVDRDKFASYITNKILENENITVVYDEYTAEDFPENTIIAAGPLASEGLMNGLKKICSQESLFYFDAEAPIIDGESINMDIAFSASRYGKGDGEYINCPMDKDEYEAFYTALVTAETAHVHGFEKNLVFEGCMPVEIMAARGIDTLRFGPLKPVGLWDPRSDKRPYAVVQLRPEDKDGRMYNIVGFQTHLTFSEQKRVFSMIPGLENAQFLRYGVMHRNTYVNSPTLLNSDYSVRERRDLYIAGQMSGVEGYVESVSSGMVAALSLSSRMLGYEGGFEVPKYTMMRALADYISNPATSSFQPMNSNFGLMPALDEEGKMNKKQRAEKYSVRSLSALKEAVESNKDMFL